ncbi:MAG: C13 family peptidase [Candidatus Helarchaeota archaeon]
MNNSIHKIFLIILVGCSLFSMGLKITKNYSTEIEINSNNKNLESKTIANIAYWIIIGGDRSDHEFLDEIKWNCNKTYEILKYCGYSDENIWYLYPDPGWESECSYADAYTTKSNIQYAIETLAAGNVSSNEALGIYMMDHGGFGYMCIPGTDINDTELNTYLDNFEAVSGSNRIFIIYEACHAGSFVSPVSDDNRIIVCSTDINKGAYLYENSPNAIFSEGFWSAIKNCKSIGEAFEEGEANVHAIGYGYLEKPWIDDDHDEVGHEVNSVGKLPNGGDGNDALNTKICKRFPCIINSLVIEKIPLKKWLSNDTNPISTWAYIANKTAQSYPNKVYVRVIPPYWQPIPAPGPDPEPHLGRDSGAEFFELTDLDGDGNWTGNINPDDFDSFDNGEYKINVICRSDAGDFDLQSTSIYINEDGSQPSDTTDPTVIITNPFANSSVSGIITITAEGDDDQALDKIQIYINNVLVNTTNMPDYYPYPEVKYVWDTNTLIPGVSKNGINIITAKAYDKTGNSDSYSISVNINITSIPSFTYSMVILGCFLIVLVVYIYKTKKITLLPF